RRFLPGARRPLPGREGPVRAALRDRQPPRLGRDPAARPPGARHNMTRTAAQHSATHELWPGSPFPLGATPDDEGVNFAIFSRHAEKIELCLFDDSGKREIARLQLRERTDFVWHGYVPGLKAGALYAYRAHGTYAPEQGHRFNPHKLVLCPYAKAIVGEIKWSDAQFGYTIG